MAEGYLIRLRCNSEGNISIGCFVKARFRSRSAWTFLQRLCCLRQVCFTMVFEKCDPEETGEISEASFQRLMAIHGVNKNAAVEVFRKVRVVFFGWRKRA